MVARYSLPHMLKSLHRLAIAIIMDSTNEEMDDEEIDVELIKFTKKMSNKKKRRLAIAIIMDSAKQRN